MMILFSLSYSTPRILKSPGGWRSQYSPCSLTLLLGMQNFGVLSLQRRCPWSLYSGSLYSVRPGNRSSNSSGSINVPRATASCGTPVTLLSSFFHLVFWPENLLLSCQLVSAFRKIYFPSNFSFFQWESQSTSYEWQSYYLTSSIPRHLTNHYFTACDSRIPL